MSLHVPEEAQQGAGRAAPRRSRSRRRKPPVRRRSGPGLGFAVVTGILGVLISPVVLLASIFRPNMRVGKQWVISIAVLTGICICVAFAAASQIERWSADAVRVLGAYDSARVRVRDLPFAEKVNFEGLRNGVDPSLLAAVMSQSSGFQTDAVSWRGARGLMQLMPKVWEEFMPEAECRGDHAPPACSETCIYSVDANLRVGAAYLRWLIDANRGDIVAALAEYSADQPADYGEPVGLDETAGLDEASGGDEPADAGRPQGYVRSIIQAWINYRGEQGRVQTKRVTTAASVRAWAGWAAIGLLCLLAVWAAVRYPNVERPPGVGDQALSPQPELREECAGGDPCAATAGDASGSGSGNADGTAL